MRSLESWLTASLFLCFRLCSSACCFNFKICAFASESCERKSSVEFGTVLATEDAAALIVDWTFEEEEVFCAGSALPKPLLSGAKRVWGVAASGAGEPNEGEGEP